ncbi:MAG: hypothetical protein V2I33_22655, partial [Kangiellaceae bacterium]|nr:hypothetical protein [Kangiellaceae bacterium]
NLMLKACGLLVYNYFSMWKLNCLEKAKLAEMRHQRALNDVVESIGRKRRKNLRAAFNAIAKDNWNTNMRQRILNKLSYVAFGRLKANFDRWKYAVHHRLLAEMEAKKAKVLDMLHWHSLGDTHRAFLRWAKNMRDGKMREYGEQVKAGFALYSVMNHFYKDNKHKLQRAGMNAIKFDPQRLMRASFDKMIRAAGLNLERAWLAWRMFHLGKDKKAADKARKNVAAANLANTIDKKRRKNLRSGLKPLAKGVANTRMQNQIFNKMHFIAFGRLRNAFTWWKEMLDKYAKIGQEKRYRIVERLIQNTLSKEHRCFLNWAAWAAAEQRKEKLIKNSINLMLKACGLLVYNYFSMWK